MTTTTASPLTSFPPVHVSPLTLGELRALDVPLATAVLLSDKPGHVQAWVVRKLCGFPNRHRPVGLCVRVDKYDNVLSIDRC